MGSYQEEIIDPGDRVSKLAHEVSVASFDNCPAVQVVPYEPGNFRGPVGFVWQSHILEEMKRGVMTEELQNDGAGGKPQFFTLVGTEEVFEELGWEIITMTADDLARAGRFPAVMTNEVQFQQVNEENFPLARSMMEGYGRALRQAGLVNITGEVAIMKHSITAFCDCHHPAQLILTWSGNCTGLYHRDLAVDNSCIRPGMYVVGLGERGYRCNGGTFFTKLLFARYGPSLGNFWANEEAKEFARKLTTPSLFYGRTLNRLQGWNADGTAGEPLARIAGTAHITGGGLWGKLGEILPEDVSVSLTDMISPPEVLLEVQRMSQEMSPRDPLTDRDAYSVFHGGCGMVLVVPSREDADTVIQECARDGITAEVIGETTPREVLGAKMQIVSRFLEGGVLRSED